MGCSWCSTTEDTINNSNFPQLKNTFIIEYNEYLLFLKNLKSDLNLSIYNDKDSINNVQTNNNSVKNKEFYLIPRNWFQNWEKRLEYAIQNDKYKSYDNNFEYKDIDNKPKFYYEFITSELWAKFSRNSIYNLKTQCKLKVGLLCNNLILFQYSKNCNYIEIFFFQNDDDLFFTNLLFSLENCDDEQKECNNLLQILKKSPIQEIFGNMHYDYSKPKFIEQMKKIIIYNKTAKISENIKNFRKTQYNLLFKPISNRETDSREKQISKEKVIENYNQIDKNNKYYNQYGVKNIIYRKGECSITGNELSRASTIMMMSNHQQTNKKLNNVTTIKIYKQKEKEIFEKNIENVKENNDNSNSYLSPIKNEHILFQNKIINQKYYLNNNPVEISNLNSINKNSTIIMNIEEDIDENFLQCILYCLINIKEISNYFLNNKENNIKENSFSYIFSKIIEYFYGKNYIDNKENKINNIYNISNYGNKLIKNCPEYNFQNIINFIIFQNSDNIISKIINCLHYELNKSNKKYGVKNKNSQIEFFDENIYLNEEKKKIKYNEFNKECQENNKSIIFDLFYGIKETKVICNNTNIKKYNYEMVNILDLYIEKITNFYIKDNKINISINDCLNYFNQEVQQQLFICPICHENQNNLVFYNICKYPRIFILYFSNNHAENDKKSIELKIDINKEIYLLNDKYELIAVISLNYKTNNNDKDKFIAYLKNNSNQKWISYEEDKISEINMDNNLENLIPVILFYHNIK